MSKVFINNYFRDIARLRQVTGSRRESVLREAFKDLLKAWARSRDLEFAPEHEFLTPQKKRVYPDGAVLHSLRVPLGWWEAKDEDDDLDREIEKKKRAGYPQDNIVFEDGSQAVLIQNRQEVIRVRIDEGEAAALERLLDLFFSWERPEIAEFRKAVELFKADLPQVLAALREKIDAASRNNPAFAKAEKKFLDHARETINPAVTPQDVREMLIQHILTEEIFAHVFDDGQFHRENNVARELYALEEKLFSREQKKALIGQLGSYYAAIRANAAQITRHAEKQKFLKVVYENFYKVYNPKAADRLGVIYTPNEIVRFMIESADWLCEKHFGRSLIDRDVNILDPATGTGTFVCELLNHFRGQPLKLHHKYKEEIFANEVAILPYYVANLNIEATYAEISGQYAEFPNLCFVDTLDNVEGLGKFSGYQHDLFGAVSEQNIERIKRQNRKQISVIIGNPPYNANQQNENDNNKNRTYDRIDKRIKDTYIAESTAQKTKAYDMYTRFFRWASDRLKDDGIVAFVTNRSFIDARTMDGFRKIAARDFAEIRIVDLGGDVRSNPKLSGTKHNVFGIQTGVAISFLVKKKHAGRCRIHYARRPELETAEEKLAFLSHARLPDLPGEEITPDAKANWLNLTSNDFESLIPIASKETKAAKTKGQERAIFKLFSQGLKTNRDEWVYANSRKEISDRVRFLQHDYNTEIGNRNATSDFRPTIKWTRKLKRLASGRQRLTFEDQAIRRSLYRPFVRLSVYYDAALNEDLYQLSQVFPEQVASNRSIGFLEGMRLEFCAIATDILPNYAVLSLDPLQFAPRYRYTSDGARIDNITDWALQQFREHYESAGANPRPADAGRGQGEGPRRSTAARRNRQSPHLRPKRASPLHGAAFGHLLPASGEKGKAPGAAIAKDDIFAYVYAALHDPAYREKYALNLKREFPRIPFHADFFRWAAWGRDLMDLHIGYEQVEPWPLARADTPDEKAKRAGLAPKTMLKADREHGVIVLDSQTQLAGVPAEAWRYMLGNRCALDWILDQYREKTPKDPTIREKFDTYRFADHKEKVIDLLARVTRVSVETMRIVGEMERAKR